MTTTATLIDAIKVELKSAPAALRRLAVLEVLSAA